MPCEWEAHGSVRLYFGVSLESRVRLQIFAFLLILLKHFVKLGSPLCLQKRTVRINALLIHYLLYTEHIDTMSRLFET